MKNNIKSFVTYRLPNELDFFSLATDRNPTTISELNFEKNGFYISNFEKNVNLVIEPENYLKNEFLTCEMTLNNSPKEETKENYLNEIKKITQEIKNENYTKIVHSRVKLVTKPTGFDYKEKFKLLCEKYPTAFVYAFYSEKTGLWIGATPELLVKEVETTKYNTVSLAGTKTTPRNWTIKEIHEQQCVTDFIQKTLSSVATNIEISKPKDSKAGNLTHLKSDFSFELNTENKLEQLIETLHPTPAVCGIPQENAKEYILKNESHNRDFYTGFLGIKSLNNQTNLYVNLRCMQVCKDNVALYIGGGIMGDSIPEEEWQETESKAKVMLVVLEE